MIDPEFWLLYPNLAKLNERMGGKLISRDKYKDCVSELLVMDSELAACVLHRAYETIGGDAILKLTHAYLRKRNGGRMPIAELIRQYRKTLPSKAMPPHWFRVGKIEWTVYIGVTKNGKYAKIGVSQNPIKRLRNLQSCDPRDEVRFCRLQTRVLRGFASKSAAFASETAFKKVNKKIDQSLPFLVPKAGYTEWRDWTPELGQSIVKLTEGHAGLQALTLKEYEHRYPNLTVFDLLGDRDMASDQNVVRTERVAKRECEDSDTPLLAAHSTPEKSPQSKYLSTLERYPHPLDILGPAGAFAQRKVASFLTYDIEYRMYELALEHCATRDEWQIGLETLQKECSWWNGPQKAFRALIKDVCEHDREYAHFHLYAVAMHDDVITFRCDQKRWLLDQP